MTSGTWLRWVNGLWLAAVFVMALVLLPNVGKLAATSRMAAAGGSAEGYEPALARWRFANVVLSLLYLALLALMVFRWRS